jgi:hypothetical protein
MMALSNSVDFFLESLKPLSTTRSLVSRPARVPPTMGKKSKKCKAKPKSPAFVRAGAPISDSGNQEPPTMSDLLSNLTLAAVSIPDSETCYFCLDEGLDDEGKPLVRDCSCSSNPAGFAHPSCIVKLAKQKNRLRSGDFFNKETWLHCPNPNCKQMYKNQFSLNLSSAFFTFAEETYGRTGNDKLYLMTAL